MKKELSVYDHTELYNNQVVPLLKQIDIICKANKIPFLFCACIKNDENGSEYTYEGNLCGSNNIVLKEDKMTDFLRILAGFKLKSVESTQGGYTLSPPEDSIEIEFTD